MKCLKHTCDKNSENGNLKSIFLIMFMILSVSGLTACASKQGVPKISYDRQTFVAAVQEPEAPLAVTVVSVPEILPLPGQLKYLDEGQESEDPSDPLQDIKKAHQAARLEPAPSGYINAVQIYPYSPGALYQLYTAPEQVSDIVLQIGEQLVSVSAGDTVRWVIGDTISGAGETAQVHILVKPIASDLNTNLVITTDRRTYHVEMHSLKETYMASLSWHYPHDELVALKRRAVSFKAQQDRIIDNGISLQNLHFRYDITGDEPPWRPVRAFDDGRHVYIEFPVGINQGEAPPLFVLSKQGNAELVNYRMKGRYYIVDRLFAAAELRLGAEQQQVVRISRLKTRGAGS